MRTIAYDVSDVNLFPPHLNEIPPKNKDNSVRPILLQYLARVKGQDSFNDKRLQRCIYFKALGNGIFYNHP